MATGRFRLRKKTPNTCRGMKLLLRCYEHAPAAILVISRCRAHADMLHPLPHTMRQSNQHGRTVERGYLCLKLAWNSREHPAKLRLCSNCRNSGTESMAIKVDISMTRNCGGVFHAHQARATDSEPQHEPSNSFVPRVTPRNSAFSRGFLTMQSR
jgi:hypothetical protein